MANAEMHFTFEISLSTLNHLGRNLYRSFMTVLGEAISNSWDADAENVWIYIDREKKSLVVKDDGDGMTSEDFQNKFLKIGYSKRKNGSKSINRHRPYIGRKGIGKLALLSCAKKISILSKTTNTPYVSGVIDNAGLDEAIKNDLNPEQYPLGKVDEKKFKKYVEHFQKGTIVYFEDINEGIRNSVDYLKKLIALYFRFSLLDESFNIFVNDEKISLDHLDDLANNTQFVWVFNDLDDPFVKEKIEKSPVLYKEMKSQEIQLGKGFIASVVKPSQLKIMATEEKVSVDLFVNGRLREKDILRHIPSTRVVESYLYGQVHVDELDDDIDRFASGREGIIAEDPKYKQFLESLKKYIAGILKDWDRLRIEINADGDPDNERITRKERRSRELFNEVSKEYAPPRKSAAKGKVDQWVSDLADDAQFNFSAYADCFVSENLIRKYIKDSSLELSKEAKDEIAERKKNEKLFKNKGNISIDLRQSNSETSYLSMDYLANLVDKDDPAAKASLSRDAREYKPIRDALAHTALLTAPAKKNSGLYMKISKEG